MMPRTGRVGPQEPQTSRSLGFPWNLKEEEFGGAHVAQGLGVSTWHKVWGCPRGRVWGYPRGTGFWGIHMAQVLGVSTWHRVLGCPCGTGFGGVHVAQSWGVSTWHRVWWCPRGTRFEGIQWHKVWGCPRGTGGCSSLAVFCALTSPLHPQSPLSPPRTSSSLPRERGSVCSLLCASRHFKAKHVLWCPRWEAGRFPERAALCFGVQNDRPRGVSPGTACPAHCPRQSALCPPCPCPKRGNASLTNLAASSG